MAFRKHLCVWWGSWSGNYMLHLKNDSLGRFKKLTSRFIVCFWSLPLELQCNKSNTTCWHVCWGVGATQEQEQNNTEVFPRKRLSDAVRKNLFTGSTGCISGTAPYCSSSDERRAEKTPVLTRSQTQTENTAVHL